MSCKPPEAPENGQILDPKLFNSYKDGDLVIFGCHSGFMLTGSDFVVCQKNGKWSKLRTKCKNAKPKRG